MPFACRLCGSADHLKLYYTQGAQRQYHFYRCGECGLVNYDLSGGLNQEKYADVWPDPFDSNSKTNRTQAASSEWLQRYVEPPARVLDIGCGNGRLLYLLREAGFAVRGLELSPFLAENIKRELDIEVDVADFQQFHTSGERFDVVILRHVLEHLSDGGSALRSINDLLVDGGIALLEFPNIEALDLKFKRLLARLRIHRKSWPADYVPGHCNEYSLRPFSRMARECGFELLRWQTYSNKGGDAGLVQKFNMGNKARVLIRKRSAAV